MSSPTPDAKNSPAAAGAPAPGAGNTAVTWDGEGTPPAAGTGSAPVSWSGEGTPPAVGDAGVGWGGAASEGAAAQEKPPERTETHFAFEHKVFDVPEAVFKLDRLNNTVALHLHLGGVAASLDVRAIKKNFSIGPETADGRMLELVEKGLRFVREIRPGDSIPNELLDGTASWTIDAKHYARARSKIIVQLVKWVTEGESAIDASVDVLKLIETPEVKSKISEAFGAAARQLGMKEMDKEMITAMISHLSNELAFIEALRDKAAGYLIIKRKLKDFMTVYRNDRRIIETVERVNLLITQPFNKLREQFQLVDAQTAEVLSSLRQLTATVKFLRGARDELRDFVLLWGDLDLAWVNLTKVERSPVCEALLMRTYRFAATYYSVTQRWGLNVA